MAEKKELAVTEEKVVEIEMERLRSFENHPFKVKADSQMIELQESVKKYGILNPLIVRPRKDGTYEIISGHRRKFAAEKIGYRKVPVIIRVLKDDDAVVSMVDSNLHREMISPSEKAFAYKMKYEVIKRRAGRRKCGQVDHNLGKKSIELIEDTQLAEIARAEACYFTEDAKGCVEHVKKYLASDDVMLRLSADMLYVFANLTLGNAREAQAARIDVKQCLQKALEEYLKAQGVVQTAMLMADAVYSIPFIYLNCIAAMCQINQKEQKEAIGSVKKAISFAGKDGIFEPFIEYHGLLQGVLEVCLRKSEPEIYKKLVDGIIAFSRGWMKIHNSQMNRDVTDLLTPLEFSIAMLACRDWTNQEIAQHMGLSVNTVKHYVSDILEKLQIDKREKIKDFVNQ